MGATVGGGGYDGVNPAVGNIAGGAASTVAGGLGNSSLATYAFIGGGAFNTVSATATASVIGGGTNNFIDTYANNSVIAGGGGNIIYSGVDHATIGGGQNNYCQRLGSTGGGGQHNTSAGLFATVPGGFYNTASGTYSFAAGQQAQAIHQGAFVWADSQNFNFNSTTNDEFSIRAQNGVRIQTDAGIHLDALNTPIIVRDFDVFANTATNSKAGIGRWGLFMEPYNLTLGIPNVAGRYFQVAKYSTSGAATQLFRVDQSGNVLAQGTVTANGVLLTSDRNAKENFAPLNPQAVLAKVTALPVTEWNYKSDDAAQKHIGPMAQDFQAAFQLSADDKHISVVDEGGVALAAIQGLNEKLEARSQKLEVENAALKQSLAELKQLVQSLAEKK